MKLHQGFVILKSRIFFLKAEKKTKQAGAVLFPVFHLQLKLPGPFLYRKIERKFDNPRHQCIQTGN